MADSTAKQELTSYLQSGDTPTGTQFATLIESMVATLAGTFDESDIDGDGLVTLTYGNCLVNGVSTAISIDAPLFCTVYGTISGTYTAYPVLSVQKVDTGSCKVELGSELPAGTYNYELFYRQ